MWNKLFWMATLDRVLRTFAQALGAILIAGGTGVLEADWVSALSTAGMAAVGALLTCVAAGAVSPASGPSSGTETPGSEEPAEVVGRR